jgi:glycosyltransferase involved in cell wall biosynthesis
LPSDRPRGPADRRARVAILMDGYIPRYRARLYELLSEQGAVEYVVFYGSPPRRNPALVATGPFRFPTAKVKNVEVPMGGRMLVFQRGVSQALGREFDGVVMAAQLRFVSSLVLLAGMKLRRRPVIFWGQGIEKDEDLRRPFQRITHALKRRLRLLMAGLGDGYLAYTEGGRERLLAAGLDPRRVFVVRNTLDVGEQVRIERRLTGIDETTLRSELGLRQDSVVLLYVGRVYREKRVGDLLEVVRELQQRLPSAVELVVIGDGPELPGLKRSVSNRPGLHFRGEIRDQVEVAKYMRVAAAVVLPGKVGLAANHAFAQGRPLITRKLTSHAPEIEYVEHGRNGLVIDGDLEQFTSALADFCRSPQMQQQLAEGAVATRAALTPESMAKAFDNGVRSVLSAGARG